jgi:hypothetical protein
VEMSDPLERESGSPKRERHRDPPVRLAAPRAITLRGRVPRTFKWEPGCLRRPAIEFPGRTAWLYACYHSTAGDAKIQCMFWCMLGFDDNAIYCDMLQDRDVVQGFYSVHLMRSHALTCSLLQHTRFWTQNPSKAASWGFNSPSRHQPKVSKCNRLHCFLSAITRRSSLAIGGPVHVVCGDCCDILRSSDSVLSFY